MKLDTLFVVWYPCFQEGRTKMEKTFGLPRQLVIRVEIFGLVFLLALVAGLFAGCGDGPEQNGSDSGIILSDSGTVDPGSVTCPVPDASKTATPVPFGVDVQYFVTKGVVTCPSSLSKTPFVGISCSDLVGNIMTPAYKVLMGPPSSISQLGGPYIPCCVNIRKVKLASSLWTGFVEETTIGCGGLTTFGGGYALCSTSGSFLGWVCPGSVF